MSVEAHFSNTNDFINKLAGKIRQGIVDHAREHQAQWEEKANALFKQAFVDPKWNVAGVKPGKWYPASWERFNTKYGTTLPRGTPFWSGNMQEAARSSLFIISSSKQVVATMKFYYQNPESYFYEVQHGYGNSRAYGPRNVPEFAGYSFAKYLKSFYTK